MKSWMVVCVIGLLGCGGPSAPPTAEQVCGALERSGIAANCTREVPAALSARARQRYDFDLVSLPGHGGAVMDFATPADFDATVAAYAEVAMLAGSHRYGNRESLIFVQMNQGASVEVGDRTRAIVEALPTLP